MGRVPLIFLLLVLSQVASSQSFTRIRGVVTDKHTGETLPFVNISFLGTTNGTTSDGDGKFYIETDLATDSLKASYIGYLQVVKYVQIGASQTINFALEEEALQLETVTVKSKKLRYRNKENPAVGIIKNVINNKDKNRMTSLDYFEYNKYEKVEFDFNNISEKFKEKRIMKDFQVIFDYVDTSDINGKTYLPIFLRETSSQVYYRQNPEREVEYRLGTKMTGFEDYFDNQGISFILDKLYQDIDIYDNNMNVLSQYFVSPVSILAPATYKFFIADTLYIDDEKLFKLSFLPRNQNDLAFIGSMFITTDSAYAIKKVDMRISDKTNLNYVEDLFVEQEFEKNEFGTYRLKTDKISMDFNIIDKNGMGVFGRRTVSYDDFLYNQMRSDTIYSGNEMIKELTKVDAQTNDFWDQARHMELSKSEQGVYDLNEEVKELPAFKRAMDLLTLVLIGYQDIGKVSIGPVGTFYSWNQIENYRIRLGGMTNEKFSRNWQLEAYAAYGFGDDEWKYSGIVSHFFTENRLDHFRVFYQRDLINPGQNLRFAMNANIFQSTQLGNSDKMIYMEQYGLSYGKRWKRGISYSLGGSVQNLQPGGILSFAPGAPDVTEFRSKQERRDQEIEVTEVTIGLRFAPNEKFYQGRTATTSIPSKYPIFNLMYWHGFEDVAFSDFSYDRIEFSVSKRFYVSPFGFTDLDASYTQLWGNVPYPLLTLARGNQSLSYSPRAFNMMNYLEFISDRQVNIQASHYFNGFIMNKIPLINKLKLRAVVTYKVLLGSLSDENKPDLVENPDLPAYPVDHRGDQATFPLRWDKPYHEASFGISNIFKLLRLDVVKRLSYFENPDAPEGWAIRARVRVEF